MCKKICKKFAIVNYNFKGEGFIQKEEIGRNLETSLALHHMHNVQSLKKKHKAS
jgi:hypothetical protein